MRTECDDRKKKHHKKKIIKDAKPRSPNEMNQIVLVISGYIHTISDFRNKEERFWQERFVVKVFNDQVLRQDDDDDMEQQSLKQIKIPAGTILNFPFHITIPKTVPQSRQIVKSVMQHKIPIRNFKTGNVMTTHTVTSGVEKYIKYIVTAYYVGSNSRGSTNNKKPNISITSNSINVNITNHDNLSTHPPFLR